MQSQEEGSVGFVHRAPLLPGIGLGNPILASFSTANVNCGSCIIRAASLELNCPQACVYLHTGCRKLTEVELQVSFPFTLSL